MVGGELIAETGRTSQRETKTGRKHQGPTHAPLQAKVSRCDRRCSGQDRRGRTRHHFTRTNFFQPSSTSIGRPVYVAYKTRDSRADMYTAMCNPHKHSRIHSYPVPAAPLARSARGHKPPALSFPTLPRNEHTCYVGRTYCCTCSHSLGKMHGDLRGLRFWFKRKNIPGVITAFKGSLG